jgi:E3 ubiquitin-protein ligase NEDD4
MPGGKDVQVTNQNKFQFVDLWYMCMLFSIQTQTSNKVKRSLDTIRKGMSKVIPEQLLNVFEPYEFEMILYGVPFIDLKEWRENSTYKQPYSENHQVIKWFWKCMETFDQDQLAHILHFCTGSSRTPIHGFKYFFLLA